MTITATKILSKSILYLGTGASSSPIEEAVSVSYTAVNVIRMTADNACQVQFDVLPEGCDNPGMMIFDFMFSGSGSPLLEAEISLAKSFEK
ncbi:hypothetical protein ACN2GR_000463 [Klebsiella pneumoniae]